jgi:ABC-type multidrug transport system fused ATPase/permease subunit
MEAFKDAIMAYALYYPIVELLSTIAVASIIWYGGHEVIRGIVGVGALVAFIQYAQRFFRPIQDLSEKYNIIQSAMAASERIFKLLDTQSPRSLARRSKAADRPGTHRVRSRVVRLSQGASAGQERRRRKTRPRTDGARRTRANGTGCCATFRSPSNPARQWHSWATPARARRP